MPVPMQGSWTISVKSKSASFAQRFVVKGATTDGIYPVGTTTAPVNVSGAAWTVSVQNNPGSGFQPSTERIKAPVLSGGFYSFDIESNDAGADQDFDDLVLTCTTPATASDFIVFGNLSSYAGRCLFNPCSPGPIVIETYENLLVALRHPVLREELERLYPKRVLPYPPPPPDPLHPQRFSPMVVPLDGRAIPGQRTIVARKMGDAYKVRSLSMARGEASPQVNSSTGLALAQLVDAAVRHQTCTVSTLAGYALAFQEYDRTAAELVGGAYTGTGTREPLGVTATDAFGNYLFRFSRSYSDALQEAFEDVPQGQDPVAQVAPDVIVQLLDSDYESSPRWNVSFLTRIDLCVPASRVPSGSGCAVPGFTEIGNIPSNRVSADGRVTSVASGTIPGIQCGVWTGTLDLWACLGPAVKYYTLMYKPFGAADWEFYTTTEKRRHVTNLIDGIKIGPFYATDSGHGFNIVFDATAARVPAPAYRNIEYDNGYVQSRWNLKAMWNSGLAADGPCDLRLDSYDADGNRITSGSYLLRLYVDNAPVDAGISAIDMAGEPIVLGGSGCTLLALDPTELSARMDVAFRVVEAHGALQSYSLFVSRCNEGLVWPVTPDGGSAVASATYTHIAGACATNLLHGTPEDVPLAQLDGTVVALLDPDSPWLGATENFTILRVYLTYQVRATNGYGVASGVTAAEKVFGIQKA